MATPFTPLTSDQEAQMSAVRAALLQQPIANLQETNAATGATGASGAVSTADLAGAKATSDIKVAQANQLKALQDAGSYFATHGDKNTGWVDPQIYNQQKEKYVNLGGNADEFDNKFVDSYVSPNNVLYDTPDSKMAQKALQVVKNVIDSYHNLKVQGPESQAVSNLPVIGQYLQQKIPVLAQEKAHNDFLTGQIGNLRQIAGAGANQGFRFNLTELNNIAGLLPSAFDDKDVANYKLTELDRFMQTNMGLGLKQLYGKQ